MCVSRHDQGPPEGVGKRGRKRTIDTQSDRFEMAGPSDSPSSMCLSWLTSSVPTPAPMFKNSSVLLFELTFCRLRTGKY